LKWIKIPQTENNSVVKIAISVKKKTFKKAVKRNLLKRRIREALRLNLASLRNALKMNNYKIIFLIVYNSPDILEFSEIQTKIQEALVLLEQKCLTKK